MQQLADGFPKSQRSRLRNQAVFFGESDVDEIILELGTVSEETQGVVAGWAGDADPAKVFNYFPD